MRNRALKFETDPFEPPNSTVDKLIQDGLEGRRFAEIPPPGQGLGGRLAPIRKHIPRIRFIGHPQPRHCVIKLLAITAGDRLHGKMKAAIWPARDLGSITALRTFKPVGTTHAKALFCLAFHAARRSMPTRKAHPTGAEAFRAKILIPLGFSHVFSVVRLSPDRFLTGRAERKLKISSARHEKTFLYGKSKKRKCPGVALQVQEIHLLRCGRLLDRAAQSLDHFRSKKSKG